MMKRWSSSQTFLQRRALQKIAKKVLEEIGPTISPRDSEQSIANRAVSYLRERGVDQTWYYNCPAFVLAGSRSCLSISGKHYTPSNDAIGDFNIITVDLSPLRDGLWGDCARSFYIEDGKHAPEPKASEFQRGFHFEHHLHQAMQKFVSCSTTFEELHSFANELIKSNGFENLDFIGNLGHSIESHLEDRLYIETGNSTPLGDTECFTFEPHIREIGGIWGFKLEHIYYFNDEGIIEEL